MIRNTRANAGIQLPPRRAETVLFEPEAAERAFWEQWETEFRACLAQLSPSQASLWGRLLLQAAGSSPDGLARGAGKVPGPRRRRAPGASRRRSKPVGGANANLLAPLTRVRRRRGDLHAIPPDAVRAGRAPPPRGRARPLSSTARRPRPSASPSPRNSTRAAARCCSRTAAPKDATSSSPIASPTSTCRGTRWKSSSALAGSIAWASSQPVRIYNFVQAGTLQEHLLQILQEKLNLFELVVGETGLVLGERFSSDEFAEEVLRRWRESEGRVAEALAGLGDELAAARDAYGEVKKLDETLFEKDYESL